MLRGFQLAGSLTVPGCQPPQTPQPMSLPLSTTRQMRRKDKQQHRKLSNAKLRTIRQSCSWAAYSTSASVSLCSSLWRYCAGEWYLEPDTAHHLPTETCCEADLICLISSVRAGKGSWREDHRTTSLCNYATTPTHFKEKIHGPLVWRRFKPSPSAGSSLIHTYAMAR